MDHRRIFAALPLDVPVRRYLAEVQEGMPDTLRLVRPGMLHVTLVFIGSVPGVALDEAIAAVDEVAALHDPFELSLREIRVVPDYRRPKLVWAAFDPSAAYTALALDLRAALAPLIPEPETRAPLPHVTLGRFRRNARLKAQPAPLVPEDPRTLPAESVELWQSRLLPDGARYETLHMKPLRG